MALMFLNIQFLIILNFYLYPNFLLKLYTNTDNYTHILFAYVIGVFNIRYLDLSSRYSSFCQSTLFMVFPISLNGNFYVFKPKINQ